MNKADLIHKLNSLEGITNDERAYLINLVNTKKKYGLVWEEKKEDVEELLRENLPILREVPEKRILSKDLPTPEKKEGTLFDGEETDELPTAPNHILIEGDNLHALTALTFTHEAKIDVIYIDPPYNTGNKDFKYNDSYVDRDDNYRHSKWLSFMNSRLNLSKRLLKDNGIIFISIDDNEQSQLKMLCDEIFNEQNFVGNIIRATGTTTGQDTGSLGKAFDYILVYSKLPGFNIGGIPLEEHDLKRYNLSDDKGNFSILQLRRTGNEDRREDRPTMYFPIIVPDGSEVFPIGPTGYESRWRVGPEKVKKMIKDDLLYFKKDNGDWKVYYKYYSENRTKRPSNLWNDIDGNKKAQIEIKDIFNDKVFDTPKPLQLINRIIQLTTNRVEKFVILDFFAGSGTTLHSTIQLNDEDGGKRQCILVTNNENNICEEVTYVRNQKVIQGYINSKGETVPGLTNNNLRYYKCDFVPREPSLKNKRQLTKSATDLLNIKENCYTECTSEFISVNQSWIKLFTDDYSQFLCIIYDDEKIEEAVIILKQVIDDKQPEKSIKVYVFSNGQYPFTEEFEEVLPHITLCALPDAIYKAYQNVLPSKKGTRILEFEDISDESASQPVNVFADNDLFNQEG